MKTDWVYHSRNSVAVICQKLSKLVDAHQCYSKQIMVHFIETLYIVITAITNE